MLFKVVRVGVNAHTQKSAQTGPTYETHKSYYCIISQQNILLLIPLNFGPDGVALGMYQGKTFPCKC